MSQAICETARYLTIQIFHTALQYRSILSSTAEDALAHLFRHIEPSALSPILFCRPYNVILSPHINIFLELIDHPNLLWMDVNYACQACVVLSTLKDLCATPANCAQFVSAVSALRLPYSSPALACAALDESLNALSILIHGEELAPGFLRYSKPPFPLMPIDRPVHGSKILQQSDTKIFVYRVAIYLCDLILYLVRFCNDSVDDGCCTADQNMKKESLRYLVKVCIRAIQVSRSVEGSPLSLATKLERASLKILSNISSIGFPSDVTVTGSDNKIILELVLREVIMDGQYSPNNCATAVDLLNYLMTDWRSEDILINNRLTGSWRESLDKLGPELSELLLMWDGDCDQSRWCLGGGEDGSTLVWEEILSRVEFWVLKGHWIYTAKWLCALRTLLGSSTERMAAVIMLENILLERDPDMSLEKWIRTVSAMLPETDVDAFCEIEMICALRQQSVNLEDLAITKGTTTKNSVY
jgi:hypothetical protein